METVNIMKKNVIIVVLIIAVIALFTSLRSMSSRAAYWMNRSEAAENYIGALEQDFPDYADVTSGTDAYSEYYEYK